MLLRSLFLSVCLIGCNSFHVNAEESLIAKVPSLSTSKTAKASIRKGKELFAKKEYNKALEYFLEAQLVDPNNIELNFLLGQSYYYTGNYIESVFAFERALSLDPSNAQARLELARAHSADGEWGAAKKALEKALADPNVPTEVRQQAERILAEMGKKQKMSISGTFIVSQSVASNPGQSPGQIPLVASGQTVLSSGNPVLSNGEKQSDQYQTFSLGIYQTLPLGKPGLKWKNTLNINSQFYHRVQSNTNQSGYIGTAVEWAKGQKILTATLAATILYLDKQISRNGVLGTLSGSYQLKPNLNARASVTIGTRHHFAQEGRFFSKPSGGLQSYAVSATYLLSNSDILTGNCSYLYDRSPTSFRVGGQAAEATRYGRPQVSASYTRVLDPRWTATGGITYGRPVYKNVNLQYLKKRKDNNWIGRGSLSYQFNQFFSADFIVSYRRNRSNLPPYDFHNLAGELSLTTLF